MELDKSRGVVGSQIDSYRSAGMLTGIQRVMRELHIGLGERLAAEDHTLVPVSSGAGPTTPRRTLGDSYFADDRVLRQRPRHVSEVDALLLLDLDVHAPFFEIFSRRQQVRFPVIALVHDIIPLNSDIPFHVDVRRSFRAYLQKTLSVADALVVTTEQVMSHLQNLGWRISIPIHVIPLGSSFSAKPPEPAFDSRLSLIYVSTLAPYKGHGQLLNVFDSLLADGYDVDLTLVGRKSGLDDPLNLRVRNHPKFGGRLRWLEHASDLEMVTEARRCSIGVFPSEDEGFGLFLEEGLCHGLKMVVRDLPVFRERKQPNVYFVGPSADQLREGILHAHRQPWVAIPKGVRSMRDAVDDWFALICDTLPAIRK